MIRFMNLFQCIFILLFFQSTLSFSNSNEKGPVMKWDLEKSRKVTDIQWPEERGAEGMWEIKNVGKFKVCLPSGTILNEDVDDILVVRNYILDNEDIDSIALYLPAMNRDQIQVKLDILIDFFFKKEKYKALLSRWYTGTLSASEDSAIPMISNHIEGKEQFIVSVRRSGKDDKPYYLLFIIEFPVKYE